MTETGFFGGKEYIMMEEPKKYKFNLLEEYKNVFLGISPHKEGLVPLLNWFSNTKNNIQQLQRINKYFFWVNQDILCHQMVLNVNKYEKWIKYPKKSKKPELNFLIPYICKLNGWTEREFNFNKDFIDLSDKKLHLLLDKKFAFEKAELKILKMKREKIKTKFEKVEKTKGFF